MSGVVTGMHTVAAQPCARGRARQSARAAAARASRQRRRRRESPGVLLSISEAAGQTSLPAAARSGPPGHQVHQMSAVPSAPLPAADGRRPAQPAQSTPQAYPSQSPVDGAHQVRRGERDALRVVAGGGADDAAQELLR